MDMERLQTALEYETGNQPNYMLLQCEEGADLENITEQLHMMSDGKFEVICIGQDGDFQKMLMIFKGLLLGLSWGTVAFASDVNMVISDLVEVEEPKGESSWV